MQHFYLKCSIFTWTHWYFYLGSERYFHLWQALILLLLLLLLLPQLIPVLLLLALHQLLLLKWLHYGTTATAYTSAVIPKNIPAKGLLKSSDEFWWQSLSLFMTEKCNWKFSQYMILFSMLMTEHDWLLAFVLCRHLRENNKERESRTKGLREIRCDWMSVCTILILILMVLSQITIMSSLTHPFCPSIFFFLSPNPFFLQSLTLSLHLPSLYSFVSFCLCLHLPAFILSCQSKEKPGSKLRQGFEQ